MNAYVKAHINVDASKVVAHMAGVSGEKIQDMGKDIVSDAKKTVQSMTFKNSTGALESGITYTKTGELNCEVKTESGHATYIEWGTRFIDRKAPFLWPAYRKAKKALFNSKKWI